MHKPCVAYGQGASDRYAPLVLSLPPRCACGPLPFTKPRAATPSEAPLPIRRYSSSSSFSLLFVCAMMLLIFCLVTIWVSVLNPALP